MPSPQAHQTTVHATCCVYKVTEFCDSCRPQTRSSSDDVSFHVQACTRRAAKQSFQQDLLGVSWRSEWDDAKNIWQQARQHNVKQFRETCAVLRQKPIQVLFLHLVCPRVLLDHHYEILFETTGDDDPEGQQILVLESSTNSGGSTNHDTGTAAPQNWILSRGR